MSTWLFGRSCLEEISYQWESTISPSHCATSYPVVNPRAHEIKSQTPETKISMVCFEDMWNMTMFLFLIALGEHIRLWMEFYGLNVSGIWLQIALWPFLKHTKAGCPNSTAQLVKKLFFTFKSIKNELSSLVIFVNSKSVGLPSWLSSLKSMTSRLSSQPLVQLHHFVVHKQSPVIVYIVQRGKHRITKA